MWAERIWYLSILFNIFLVCLEILLQVMVLGLTLGNERLRRRVGQLKHHNELMRIQNFHYELIHHKLKAKGRRPEERFKQ